MLAILTKLSQHCCMHGVTRIALRPIGVCKNPLWIKNDNRAFLLYNYMEITRSEGSKIGN